MISAARASLYVYCKKTTQKLFQTNQKTSFSMDIKPNESIVTVKQGRLRGSVRNLLDGTPYYSFQGVPYAQPPVGELRFQAPRPLLTWEGIHDATKHGPICPQYNMFTKQIIEGDENCLFLNVYTKSLSKSKLPVMVYIHGGGFLSGSGDESTYGPLFLLQHDVILVTLNYRLEALGFLCLDTPEVPGNAGIKDQVAALKWVKENIEKFGGDPDNITLFGQSSGAVSVTYHLLSDMSKDLFHKAIVQSGTCNQDWGIDINSVDRAFRVGKFLGIETNDKDELLKYLRKQPAVNLATVSLKTRTDDEKYRGLPFYILPVIEKDGTKPFISEDPMDLLVNRKANKVPLLIGYNSAEALNNTKDQMEKGHVYNSQPQFSLPKEIVAQVTKEKLSELGERLKQFYLGDKGWHNDNVQKISDMQTDRQFTYNTNRFIHYYHVLAPTYLYRFDCDTELNFYKISGGSKARNGACHSDDLAYLFSNRNNVKLYKQKKELKEIIDKMTKIWTDFAKTGNPTPDNQLGFKWEPFTPSQEKYLSIGEELVLLSHADHDRVRFWNELYREAGLPFIHYTTDKEESFVGVKKLSKL